MKDYTGFDFDRLGDMELFEFWLYLRDAIVYKYSQTSEGLEYLEKCWMLQQTKPDRAGLRNKFRK